MSDPSKIETYVSVDTEANGPIPGPHSMWSLGAVARDRAGQELSRFSRTLEDLPGSAGHPDTMAFWAKEPEAHAAARRDPVPPDAAMWAFHDWLRGLPGKVVFAGYPATYDFMFVYWYYWRFVGEMPPFSFSGLDMKTLAMALLRLPYRQSTKKNFPSRWTANLPPHTHEAEGDADEQGIILARMLADLDAPVARLTQDETILVRRLLRDALAGQTLSDAARAVAQRLHEKLRALGPVAQVEYILSEPAYVGRVSQRVDEPVRRPVHPTHRIVGIYGGIVRTCTACEAGGYLLAAPSTLLLAPCPGRPYPRAQLMEDANVVPVDSSAP